MGRPRQPIRHGTPAGYIAHRRRGEEPCPECVASYADKQRAYYEQNRAEIADNPDDPRHGTIHAYNNLACRCPQCKQAARDYRSKRAGQ